MINKKLRGNNMFSEKIELGQNFKEYTFNKVTAIDFTELEEISENMNVRINLHIDSLESLKEFNKLQLLALNNIHVHLTCTKQIFLNLNTSLLLNETLIKSIFIENNIITLNFYLCETVSESVLLNNTKLFDRLTYMSDDIKIHSKNHEILYHANNILKELKKSDKKLVDVAERVSKLNEFTNK